MGMQVCLQNMKIQGEERQCLKGGQDGSTGSRRLNELII